MKKMIINNMVIDVLDHNELQHVRGGDKDLYANCGIVSSSTDNPLTAPPHVTDPKFT